MDRKFFFSFFAVICLSFSYKHFFVHECVGLWCSGKLIALQEFTMMIILKGELTSVFNSIKRAGANLSLSDASGSRLVEPSRHGTDKATSRD